MVILCLYLLLLVEIEVYEFLWILWKVVLEIPQKNRFYICDKNKIPWHINIKHDKNNRLFVGQ